MKLKSFKAYIVFEDDNLIAINKPAGVSSLQDRFGRETSIQQLAQAYCETAQLCHRLDKETSGILVIAKNPETYREMAISFEKRTIKKTYRAVVDGRHYFQDLVVSTPLSVSSRGRAKVDRKSGKEAETAFSVMENFRHYTLVSCFPKTGRLHQIRIHLTTQNAPISGDGVYGGSVPYLKHIKRNFKNKKDEEDRPMIGRTALHAYRLEFELFDKKHSLTAELPKDIHVFLTLLRKYDAG